MRVPPQQQGGKARAEGGGRQQVPSTYPNFSQVSETPAAKMKSINNKSYRP